MVANCEQVWREVSNYLEGEVDPGLRAALEEHVRTCPRCAAVVAGTRNVLELYGDQRLVEVPAGYSRRLRDRLEATLPRRRGTSLGWMVALAAAAMLLIGFEIGHFSTSTPTRLRSAHAQPPVRTIPANLVVVVTGDSKTFHLPGCDVIHNRSTQRTMTAAQAESLGYAPCVRCLRKYVNLAELNLGALPASPRAYEPEAELGDPFEDRR